MGRLFVQAIGQCISLYVGFVLASSSCDGIEVCTEGEGLLQGKQTRSREIEHVDDNDELVEADDMPEDGDKQDGEQEEVDSAEYDSALYDPLETGPPPDPYSRHVPDSALYNPLETGPPPDPYSRHVPVNASERVHALGLVAGGRQVPVNASGGDHAAALLDGRGQAREGKGGGGARYKGGGYVPEKCESDVPCHCVAVSRGREMVLCTSPRRRGASERRRRDWAVCEGPCSDGWCFHSYWTRSWCHCNSTWVKEKRHETYRQPPDPKCCFGNTGEETQHCTGPAGLR